MSICISLRLQNQQVAIIGGGKVALRKCMQFQKEHARVRVIAPEVLEEIKQLDVEWIKDTYHPCYIQNCLYVYTATNHPQVNQDVIQYCVLHQILCGSAQENPNVTAYSMQSIEDDYLQIAMSTNGLCPGLSKEMLVYAQGEMHTRYQKRLQYLQVIRNACDKRQYTNLRAQLSTYSHHKLEKILHMLTSKQVQVLVYHGVRDPQILYKEYPAFEKQLQQPNTSVISCVASTKVSMHCKQHHPDVFLLQEVLFIAKHISVPFTFHMMLIRKGRYFDKLSTKCETVGNVAPFWFHKQAQQAYIQKICEQHAQQQVLFVLHDYDEPFAKLCEMYDAKCMGLHDELPSLSLKPIYLVPVFMIKGSHFVEDVNDAQKGIHHQLTRKGYHVHSCADISLLQQPWVVNCFLRESKK